MINDEANEVIKEIFDSSKNRYQKNLKGSEFGFDYVQLLYYKCHKLNHNCGGSYINSPECKKQKSSNKSYQQKIWKKKLSIRCNSPIKL